MADAAVSVTMIGENLKRKNEKERLERVEDRRRGIRGMKRSNFKGKMEKKGKK